MKILFCHDGPLKTDENNNYYGVAHNDKTFRRYFNIAEELSVAIRVQKVLEKDINNKLTKISVTPFKVISMPNVSSSSGFLMDSTKARKKLHSEVCNTDFIVARIPSVIGFMAIDLAIKIGKPYLVEVVTCPWDSYWNHSLKGKLVAPFMYLKTKNYIKNSKYVIYVTNEFLQRRYPTKGISVNCSNVALNDFNEKTLVTRLKKIEQYSPEAIKVIGTTAAVDVKFKGQKYIIKALAQLKKKGITNYQYQLVGGGDNSYLKKVAEKYDVINQVDFLGALPHEKVFDWLSKIDFYVQPSRQEGLPRALIEAMSQGLPSLGARTAGIPELLENDFIFSNSRNNINEIVRILESFSKEKMKSQAVRNYQESKKYKNEIIEDKRNQFFKDFRETYIKEKSLKL